MAEKRTDRAELPHHAALAYDIESGATSCTDNGDGTFTATFKLYEVVLRVVSVEDFR